MAKLRINACINAQYEDKQRMEKRYPIYARSFIKVNLGFVLSDILYNTHLNYYAKNS